MSDDKRARLLLEYMDRLREKYPSAPSDRIRAEAERLVAKKLGKKSAGPPQPPPLLSAATSPVRIEPPVDRVVRQEVIDVPSGVSPAQVVYVRDVPRFRGPPHDCRECGGPLRKGRQATNTGGGCLCIIIGIVLTPFLVGILLILLGLYLGSKAEGYFECRNCHQRYRRTIRWYEFG